MNKVKKKKKKKKEKNKKKNKKKKKKKKKKNRNKLYFCDGLLFPFFFFFCSKIYNIVLNCSPWQTIYNK